MEGISRRSSTSATRVNSSQHCANVHAPVSIGGERRGFAHTTQRGIADTFVPAREQAIPERADRAPACASERGPDSQVATACAVPPHAPSNAITAPVAISAVQELFERTQAVQRQRLVQRFVHQWSPQGSSRRRCAASLPREARPSTIVAQCVPRAQQRPQSARNAIAASIDGARAPASEYHRKSPPPGAYIAQPVRQKASAVSKPSEHAMSARADALSGT